MKQYSINDLVNKGLNSLIDENQRFEVCLEKESNNVYESDEHVQEEVAILRRVYWNSINE